MSLCLMCGCCCEACPNYGESDFVGAQMAVSASKILNQENDKNHRDDIKKSYKDKTKPHNPFDLLQNIASIYISNSTDCCMFNSLELFYKENEIRLI